MNLEIAAEGIKLRAAANKHIRLGGLYGLLSRPELLEYARGMTSTRRKDRSTQDATDDTKASIAALSLGLKSGRVYEPHSCSAQTPCDSIVAEAVRLLLEAIYEPIFSDASHGHRCGRNCHTALLSAQQKLRGCDWIISGSAVTEDTANHETAASVLRRRIRDERFTALAARFLALGYARTPAERSGYSGTIRRSGFGALWSNIFLHELDMFLESMTAAFAKKDVRVGYIRYAESYIIGIAGSGRIAADVTGNVRTFLDSRPWACQVGAEKPIGARKRVRFLGYDVMIEKKAKNVQLLVPRAAWEKRLLETGAGKICGKQGDRQTLKPQHISHMIYMADIRILSLYNAETESIYRYYSLAGNVSSLGRFAYIMRRSMAKTLAAKHRSTVAKIMKKHSINGRFGIRAENGSVVYFARERFAARFTADTSPMLDVPVMRDLPHH